MQERIVIDGVTWTGIRDVDGMPPFFTTSVGDNDAWLFAGSNGALCAGRRDPDLALFPYVTVDRILDSARSAGPLTSILITEEGGPARLWEPWGELPAVHPRRRSLYKHPEGNGLCFEETDLSSGLVFRCLLSTCARYGIIRECTLSNTGPVPATLRVLDGFHRLVPPGVGTEMWMNFSYLAQAYMRHDRVPGLPLGVFTLNAAITDRAEPREIHRACAAWVCGLPADTGILLSTRQLEAFRTGGVPAPETEIRGETGALLALFPLTLRAGESKQWIHGLDTNLEHGTVLRLASELASPGALAARVRDELAADRRGLRLRLASADGLARSGDATGDEHHLSNTLFNIMRGGVLPPDQQVSRDGFAAWLKVRNKRVAQRHSATVAAWPERLRFDDLPRLASATGDAQLERLAGLYLPLSFSRRHGDPSRPWNRFSIRLRNEEGKPIIAWQGNWRDIFQNWEALALSFPTALPGMISSFLDASSLDGYNPYRITSEGVDWEVPDPNSPWAHHGYWGDHQIVYLQRLLSLAEAHMPGWIRGRLDRRLHVSVEVPYRITSLEEMLKDPRETIGFDAKEHARAVAAEKELGTDGRLMPDGDGDPLLLSMAEKLLTPVLAKLSNLVPGGGIWLNTQRPEWNDANNALVGYGLSMVTVSQLRRHLDLLLHVFDTEGEFPCTEAGAEFLSSIAATLSAQAGRASWNDQERHAVVCALGHAGEKHRTRVYSRSLGAFRQVSHAEVRALLKAALPVIDACIRSNRRNDGLFHSYNILELGTGTAGVIHLQPMLEGQVAVLGSGLLNGTEALALLNSLRESPLYRQDQHSYILYPDKQVPTFLERNRIPAKDAASIALVGELLKAGHRGIVCADGDGGVHFSAELGNAKDLSDALDRLAASRPEAVARDRQALLQVWEDVFHHRSFLGRSGTMFAFEGLGSIYWHMVSKLLLGVQENHDTALHAGAPAEVVHGLAAKYYDIRSGLGPAKSPAAFGAFPTDPYSHTPRHRGAQQPGMTGQVKEELLSRRGELGVVIEKGLIRFNPTLLRRIELLTSAQDFRYVDMNGVDGVLPVAEGSLAFTVCQVPVVYHTGGKPGIRLHLGNGGQRDIAGLTLDAEASRALFERSGTIHHVEVTLGAVTLL